MNRAFKIILSAIMATFLILGTMLSVLATDETKEVRAVDITADFRLSDEGTAYYISSSKGNDENDGLSEDSPWKSFAHLYNMDLKPGDRVLLKRGDVWNERLTLRGNGREDAWIFVGSYGDLQQPKPEISLQNGRHDIGILVTDISVGGKSGFGLNYVWIDNLKVSNSYLGIYFRYDSSQNNKGMRVTNCSFSNINCPELMKEAMTDVSFLLSQKGNLEDYHNGMIVENGGGAAEYIWPTAINIGGRPPLPLADVTVPGRAEPANVISEIELYQNDFDGCIIAVGANCYNYHFGTGPNQCYTYTTNWNVCGLTATNTMTMINIDSADFGYDGTEESKWGRWSNIQAKSGMTDYTMAFGTTQALFSCCKNLYISNSSFNDCHNNGQADGCGFDFERAVHNFTLDSCVFANNQGQGILVMQTTMENQVTGEQAYTPNTKNTIKNCLFYNNMTNVMNENYRYDITVFNPNNEHFVVMESTFYFREKTAGGATVDINAKIGSKYSAYGPQREGFQGGRNTMICSNDLPAYEDVIAELGMEASVAELLPRDKTWYNYTEEGVLPEESETETHIESTETSDEATTESNTETLGEIASETDVETMGGDASGCRSALAGTAIASASAVISVAVFSKKRKGKS
ncbi:MAG: hypothetical protein IJY39_04595 [Clostridia bacterium]|nr:hypothetical protein [Clostridia bacterium]